MKGVNNVNNKRLLENNNNRENKKTFSEKLSKNLVCTHFENESFFSRSRKVFQTKKFFFIFIFYGGEKYLLTDKQITINALV